VARNEDLGDLTFRLDFTGYLPVKGVVLPNGFNTAIDFRWSLISTPSLKQMS